MIIQASGDFDIGNMKRVHISLSCDNGKGEFTSGLKIMFLESDKWFGRFFGEAEYNFGLVDGKKCYYDIIQKS